MESATRKRLNWLALACGVMASFYLLSPVLGPFLLGLGLAYLCHPMADRLQGFLGGRAFPALLVVLFILLLFIGFWLLFLPFALSQVQYFVGQVPFYIQSATDALEPWLTNSLQGRLRALNAQSHSLVASGIKEALVWVGRYLLGLLSNVQAITNLFFYMLVTPFVAFHALKDWEKLCQACVRLVPHGVRHYWLSFFGQLDQSVSHYLRGQILVCLGMAGYLATAFGILGVPHGVLLGLMTGLLVFLPYVGMFMGSCMAFLLVLGHDPTWFNIAALSGALLGGQVLEALLFIPWFIGKRIGLHPAWVLFSLFAAAAVLGGWGVFLAMPLALVAQVSVRWVLHFYRESAFYGSEGRP